MLRRILLVMTLAPAIPAAAAAQANAGSGPTDPDISAYSLLPGDIIRVRIWREEDLSGDFQVDQDGTVTLPLLGQKQVVGILPDILRDQLTSDYDEYLVNPSVNVSLLRRVTVLGEVRAPGLYPVDATVSVAELIAIAQGITPDGDMNKISLRRNGQTIRQNVSGTLAVTEAGIRSGDQLRIGKRSWLSRNLTSVVGIASIVSNIVSVIIITSK